MCQINILNFFSLCGKDPDIDLAYVLEDRKRIKTYLRNTMARIDLCIVLTAIPYRESTGFLQGIPCVVSPPLHALAVYRV